MSLICYFIKENNLDSYFCEFATSIKNKLSIVQNMRDLVILSWVVHQAWIKDIPQKYVPTLGITALEKSIP